MRPTISQNHHDLNHRGAGLGRWALGLIVICSFCFANLAAQPSVSFQYIYDANQQLVRVIDSLDNVVTYDYDAAGNLVAVTQTTIDELGPPVITQVTPQTVNAGEILQVILAGTNFFQGQFTVAHPQIQIISAVVNDRKITSQIWIPNDADVGPTILTITTDLGSDSIALNIIGPLPKLGQIVPDRGTSLGGTPVILFGTEFTADTQVFFGSTPALSVLLNSSSFLTAEAPPGPPSQFVDVVVSNSNGTTRLPNAFQYTFPFSLPAAEALSVGDMRVLSLDLAEPAPADLTVMVTVDNPNVASAPVSVDIPAGGRTGLIALNGVGLGTTRLQAELDDLFLTTAIYVAEPVAGDFDIANASVGGLIAGRPAGSPVGGQIAPNLLPAVSMTAESIRTLSLSLSEPAPEDGLTATLFSSNSQVASVPAEIEIAGGEQILMFDIVALASGTSFLNVLAGDDQFRLHLLVDTSVERTGIVRSPIPGVLAPSGVDIGPPPLGVLVAPREPTFGPIIGVEVEE